MTLTMPYTAHPFADLFPMMGDAELRQLADDIRANGQREVIYLAGTQVLDGRNRLKACEMAGVSPRVEQYAGDDLLGFVVSKNLHRRHLTDSQRATVAARIANMKMQDTLKQNARSPDLGSGGIQPVSIDKAAEMLNVSTGNVHKAKQVLRDGVPELVQAVESGQVTLNAAEMLVRLPEEEQVETVKSGPEAARAKATEIRKEKKSLRPPTATGDDAKQQGATRPPETKQPDTPKQQQRKTSSPPANAGVGLTLAAEAIDVLMRIPRSDPQRKRAFEKVRDWLDNN